MRSLVVLGATWGPICVSLIAMIRVHDLGRAILGASFFQSLDAEVGFPKSHGKPRADDKRVLSGIIFINRNGLRWRDTPAVYGPHKTLYSRWNGIAISRISA